MKQSIQFHGLLFLIFILFSYSTTAARLLAPTQSEEEIVNVSGFSSKDPIMEAEQESWNLMGVEECSNGDEECLKRRMISEAHLDYIYTQHHKP